MLYDDVKAMQAKFGIGYDGPPRELPADEREFRLGAFEEEINEYKAAVTEGNLAKQIDALSDLIIFAVGAAAQHGVNIDQVNSRVMCANMMKELVQTADDSKRGYKSDLIKPPEWREPYIDDLLSPTNRVCGVILLEGPDGTGKTTLAEHLVKEHNALYLHATWSKDLEPKMEGYLWHILNIAEYVSCNQLVVIDRCWITELVYTDVFREDAGRDEMHFKLHQFFAMVLSGLTIYCLPHNRDKFLSHFKDVKDQRDEMYSDMSKVYDAFLALWEGAEVEYQFSCGRTYLNVIEKAGGFKSSPAMVRYDWNTDGQDIEAFFKNLPIIMEEVH